MSFSSEVKEELSRQIHKSRHCQIAEIAAIISLSGKLERLGDGGQILRIYTENIALARKYFTLIKKTFAIHASISIRQNAYLHKGRTCILSILGSREIDKVLQAIKWRDSNGMDIFREALADGLLLKSSCCKRAFIRGAFLASGSMSDPEKSYHFEIVCPDRAKAHQLMEVINYFTMDAKIVQRKKWYVVYLKEGAQVVDILNIMGAHVALMNLENVRIVKEMRNSVNRQVNCETANIHKTVNAAVKQIEDITYIQNTVGLDSLSDGLQEIAQLRLAFPEAALKELGILLNPAVGKSGVNHRLRKLSEIADGLRDF
ncbi:DNA-binding protein WhiA [Lachnospiraceae bacterium ZAX-1]